MDKRKKNLNFIDPQGNNLLEIKKIINKVIDLILKKLTNAEKFSPLPETKKKIFNTFNFNDLPAERAKHESSRRHTCMLRSIWS